VAFLNVNVPSAAEVILETLKSLSVLTNFTEQLPNTAPALSFVTPLMEQYGAGMGLR
jgi:hypothetical protein